MFALKKYQDITIELLISEIKSFLESTYWLTPLNLAQEKAKVLDKYNYNPIFKYPDIPFKKVQEFLNKIDEIEIQAEERNINKLILIKKLEELSLKLKLLLSRGTEGVTEITGKLYDCGFNKESLIQAKKDSKINKQFSKRENLDSAELVNEIKKYLNSLNLKNWKVELSDLKDFYIRIKPLHKEIFINSDFNWDFTDLDNTLAHEIDGHVIRAVNAQRQKKKFFRKPLPFYLKTEEGLASFLGDYCSTSSEISRKHHAVKYLAGKIAQEASFAGVFEFLTDSGFTPELAFQRSFRLKRGFEDTSLHGCFLKEAVYYEGMLAVKNFIDKGGDIGKLFSGKFGLLDLEFTPKIKNPIIPQRLKLYLKPN